LNLGDNDKLTISSAVHRVPPLTSTLNGRVASAGRVTFGVVHLSISTITRITTEAGKTSLDGSIQVTSLDGSIQVTYITQSSLDGSIQVTSLNGSIQVTYITQSSLDGSIQVTSLDGSIQVTYIIQSRMVRTVGNKAIVVSCLTILLIAVLISLNAQFLNYSLMDNQQ